MLPEYDQDDCIEYLQNHFQQSTLEQWTGLTHHQWCSILYAFDDAIATLVSSPSTIVSSDMLWQEYKRRISKWWHGSQTEFEALFAAHTQFLLATGIATEMNDEHDNTGKNQPIRESGNREHASPP